MSFICRENQFIWEALHLIHFNPLEYVCLPEVIKLFAQPSLYPQTYAPSLTASTALGVLLGAQLHATYLTPGSPSLISSISGDIADTHQIKVRAKAGGEGAVVFDSAIALLHGIFPPSPRNKITLANETVVVAPLGGYQYVSSAHLPLLISAALYSLEVHYSGDGGAR
ncbi:hypothetical protein B0H17DRAFT_1138680 [Mycena rosella]|uniref:Uncharacterized protein n=1 Tax=Mycena rosella TaxID=1033263 RepID=A0AAD7GC06_MYCRO|nr:hypothetical protein B0H17DRAFT_1138680 [Mycena rosella]